MTRDREVSSCHCIHEVYRPWHDLQGGKPVTCLACHYWANACVGPHPYSSWPVSKLLSICESIQFGNPSRVFVAW